MDKNLKNSLEKLGMAASKIVAQGTYVPPTCEQCKHLLSANPFDECDLSNLCCERLEELAEYLYGPIGVEACMGVRCGFDPPLRDILRQLEWKYRTLRSMCNPSPER